MHIRQAVRLDNQTTTIEIITVMIFQLHAQFFLLGTSSSSLIHKMIMTTIIILIIDNFMTGTFIYKLSFFGCNKYYQTEPFLVVLYFSVTFSVTVGTVDTLFVVDCCGLTAQRFLPGNRRLSLHAIG